MLPLAYLITFRRYATWLPRARLFRRRAALGFLGAPPALRRAAALAAFLKAPLPPQAAVRRGRTGAVALGRVGQPPVSPIVTGTNTRARYHASSSIDSRMSSRARCASFFLGAWNGAGYQRRTSSLMVETSIIR